MVYTVDCQKLINFTVVSELLYWSGATHHHVLGDECIESCQQVTGFRLCECEFLPGNLLIKF